MPTRAVLARREVTATAVIVAGLAVAAFVLGARRGELAPGQCEPVLERYVELRVRASYEKVTSSVLEEMEDRSKRGVKAAEAMGDCARHLTQETADCAMKAPSADELERCFP